MSALPAVFLDRDGVVNCNVLDASTGDYGAPRSPAHFELAAAALPALQALRRAGFLLFLVSNQPDYAKGKASREALAAVHARLEAELLAAGIDFAAFFYCCHHPQGVVPEVSGPCDCRKPSPFFLFKARDQFGVSLEASWMIGDRGTDIECGRAAGARTIRVQEDHPASRGPCETPADFEALDLAAAAEIILATSAMRE